MKRFTPSEVKRFTPRLQTGVTCWRMLRMGAHVQLTENFRGQDAAVSGVVAATAFVDEDAFDDATGELVGTSMTLPDAEQHRSSRLVRAPRVCSDFVAMKSGAEAR